MLKKLFIALMFLSPSVALAESGTIFQLSQWLTSGGYVKMASSTAGLWIPSLGSSGNCLVTDINGKVSTQTCSPGGGGSGIGWTWNSINLLRTTTTTDDVLIGRTATTTRSKLEINGTTTATNFVATSTTVDSVLPRLSVTNSTTTAATSTSLFSTLLRATTGYFTSLFLPSLATPAGSLVAVDANGQFIATNTPSGSVSGGTAGMLTSWDNSTTLTSTSVPTFGYFTGTSTATSSLAGALSVKRLSIGTDPTVLTSSSTAVDGSPGLLFHYPGATNYSVGAVGNYIDDNNYSGLAIQSNAAFNADLFGFNNGSAAKITSVGIIPQSNGTAPTTFNVNGDTSILGAGRGVGEFLENWNDGAFSFNGLMIAVTDIASDASSRLITAEVGGQERFSVGKTGNLTLGNASNKATFDVSALSGSDKTITVQNKTGTLVVSTPTQANTDSTSWTAGDATGVDQQGSSITIFAGDATNGNAEGGGLTQFAGNGIGTGGGGGFELQAGTGGATGNGGAISITAGSGGATSGDGADLTLFAGGTTAGSVGHVKIGDPTSFVYAKLGTSLITADRTFEFPDSSGTLCTTVTCAGGSGASSTLLTDANTFTGSTSINTLTTIRSTSTQATSTNFFSSILTATSGFLTNLFVTGSSTLQDVTMRNATTTNATTTSLAATTICLIGDTCRTTWPAGAGSSYPFYTLSTTQATNTLMAFTAGALGTYFSGTSTATSSFVNFNGEFWATSTSVDIGKQVMNYYNNYCWGDMCIVNIPKGSYTQNVATFPMNFNTVGKRISLRCAEGDGTIINLTGAGTSTRINAGNGGTLALLKTYDAVVGCTFSGNLTAGQVGIEIGGSNGAQGAMVRKTSVFTTDKGISFSANTNAGASLIDSNSQYNNKNLAGEMSGDGGEGIEIINSNLSDCQSGHTLKCVDFSTTQGSSVHIINSEIDDAELYVADGNLNLTVENSHLENPDTALTGQYNFIRTGSGGYGALTLIGNTFWNGAGSSALSPYSFIYAGNPVRMMGNSFGSNGARIGSVIQTYGDGRVEATGNFYPLNTVAANNIPVFSTSTAVDFMVDPVGHGVGIGTSTGNSGLSVVGNVYVSGSTTLQNFTGLKSTTTAATTTSLFSTTASSTNLFSQLANFGTLTVQTILANGSTTLQNFTGLKATTTAATTTNLFSSIASSTNLFTTNFFAGGLNTCNAANQALTYTNGLFGCNSAITGASTTLLANNNTFSGANSFATLLVTGSTTLQNFTGLKSTTTNATSTSLAVTGISTSTFANGISITSGCFAIGSTCLTSGGSGASSTLYADNGTFSGANIFNNITRSTTTDATTTNIFSTKASTSAFFGAGLTNCSSALSWTNGSFGCVAAGAAASTTLLADNNTFSGVNNFTGKVGHGTSSPYARLSVQQPASDLTSPIFMVQSSSTAANPMGTTTLGIDKNGLALFGTSSADVINGVNSFVTFATQNGHDEYVSFKNNADGYSMGFQIGAASDYNYEIFKAQNSIWRLGTNGNTSFDIRDDTNGNIVASIAQGAPANTFIIDSVGSIFSSAINIFRTAGNNLFSIVADSQQIFWVTSTSTDVTGMGARVSIGHSSTTPMGVLDHLKVDGRYNNGDNALYECVGFGNYNSATNIVTNTSNTVSSVTTGTPCGPYSWIEDAAGQVGFFSTQGHSYLKLSAGATGVTNAIGNGMAMRFNTAWLASGTNTPVMQLHARPNTANASSTVFLIGFSTSTGVTAGATIQTEDPKVAGCYFIATTTANWQAVCATANYALKTQVDTGVASSTTIGGSGQWREFRIELSSTAAYFYIESVGDTGFTRVATITTNIPTTLSLNPTISVGKNSAGLSPSIDIGGYVRTWAQLAVPSF